MEASNGVIVTLAMDPMGHRPTGQYRGARAFGLEVALCELELELELDFAFGFFFPLRTFWAQSPQRHKCPHGMTT